METIKITDSRSEMAKIGKEIFFDKPTVYKKSTVDIIKGKIQQMMPTVTETEANEMFYASIYDFWVYGNNIDEEFYYDFIHKSHKEKSEYMTHRARFNYMDFLNDKENSKICRSKWLSYNKFNKHYHREAILLHDESDYEKFADFASRHKEFVVKPDHLWLAKGVRKVNIADYENLRNMFDEIIRDGRELAKNDPSTEGVVDVHCEELIKQSEIMSSLHPWSVNAVRVTTILSMRGGGV